MHVGFFHARVGDFHEFRLGAHLFDGGTAGVAHGGAQAAHQLVNDGAHGALVGYPAFDTFRYQLLDAGSGILEVAVGGTGGTGHGTHGAHATVGLVVATLEQLHVTRRFFGAGQQRADHDGTGASGNRLGNVTGEADTTVSDQRHTGALQGFGHIGDGSNLRHADARHDTGGADGARADTHFHGIRTGGNQVLGGGGGGDVATNHLYFREVFLHPGHPVDHTLGMAVGGVYHDHVHTGFHQRGDTFVSAGTGTNSSANPQTTLGVLAGVRVFGGFFDVFHGDHAAQLTTGVHHHDFFNAMLVQQRLHLIRASAFLYGHQPVLAGHDVLHTLVVIGDEAGVTAGHDAHHQIAFYHRHTGDLVGFGDTH